MMNSNYQLILASKSPRRQELLRALDLDFEVIVKPIEESFPESLPVLEVAEYLANQKSNAFDQVTDNKLLITSDTVVISGSKILGKAKNTAEAFEMIRMLSGETHSVATGVCIRSEQKRKSFTEITKVTFDTLDESEIRYYIEKYQPFDKAGAYGIQEWLGMIAISKIEGDYYNVMGLPLNSLYRHLKEF